MATTTHDIAGDGHVTDPPLVTGNLSFHEITDLVAQHAEKKPPRLWYVAFAVANLMLLNLLVMIAYQVWNGVGVWGNNVPVGWGWPIRLIWIVALAR